MREDLAVITTSLANALTRVQRGTEDLTTSQLELAEQEARHINEMGSALWNSLHSMKRNRVALTALAERQY